MRRQLQQQGFTLIEMLVAVLMIAILFTLVFGGIDSATDARQATMEASDDLVGLQRAFMWLDKDINQMLNRPIRDVYGNTQDALVVGTLGDERVLEFSRGDWPIPSNIKKDRPLNRSDIARVAYALRPDEKANSRRKPGEKESFNLYRLYWLHADRANEEPQRSRRIARGVLAFKSRFMDESKAWQQSWPPLSQQGGGPTSVPRAVEIELELQRWGKVRRVFRVVDAHGL